MDEVKVNEYLLSGADIVGLVDALVWPVVFLISLYTVKDGVPEAAKEFLKNIRLKELSTPIVSGKFEQVPVDNTDGVRELKQAQSCIEENSYSDKKSGGSSEYTKLIDTQIKRENKLSGSILNTVRDQLQSLSKDEKVDLLERTLAIELSHKTFASITQTIYLSQYNYLLSLYVKEDHKDPIKNIFVFFAAIRETNETLQNTDASSFVGYLVNSGLMIVEGDQHQLTLTGESYVEYIQNNPNIYSMLTKI
ncbi:hypothetical protein [Aliamphritea hakodatensis]|uniref:hypothetical protein n=1 Tax=Aliamphritea hakodatensis TaxID=2895352 RepID=UPI0022FD72F4|nr:hypothetical protein [Aliamphritea hakodatensis]